MGKAVARKSFRRKTGKAGDDCTEQSAARKDGAKKTAAFDPAVVSAGSAPCTDPAAGGAGHLSAGAKSSAGAVGSGDSDRRQSNRFYPDPVGCADVRFKKQVDLVYRAMRRERDVLVLSLSWDGAVDCLQSNSLYPDPVGCADVRFKKQADLVYRAMRRERDVLVLSLSWDGDSGSAAVDCRCVHLGLSGCKGARRTRLAVGADYLDFIAVAGWSGLSDCPQGGAQTLPLLRVDAGKGFPLLQPLWQAVPLL